MANLFNSDYLFHLCKKYGLAPSKRYGQNYLIDAEVIETIVGSADLRPTDTVVEVGPGFGVLTLALAPRAGKVIAFEIERKLQPYWVELQKNQVKVEMIWGNVLREFEHSVPFRGAGNYKVIANLPYQITSPVIRLFLEAEQPPGLMVLMVQKEVAERICAAPGQMSLLSVAVQYYAEVELVVTVPRSAFWPEPRVDSAVIRIINKKQRAINKEFDKHFFVLVKAGFSNRRKLLIKNILPAVGKKHKTALTQIFIDLDLSPKARAQELTIEQWMDLARLVKGLG